MSVLSGTYKGTYDDKPCLICWSVNYLGFSILFKGSTNISWLITDGEHAKEFIESVYGAVARQVSVPARAFDELSGNTIDFALQPVGDELTISTLRNPKWVGTFSIKDILILVGTLGEYIAN